jgi:hypothetical protein
VANIGNLIYCDARGGAAAADPGCAASRDGCLQYNTAVAFDTVRGPCRAAFFAARRALSVSHRKSGLYAAFVCHFCAQPLKGPFLVAWGLGQDGRYLACVHKQNLWSETDYFDEPVDCQRGAFTTSFGVAFGCGPGPRPPFVR